MGGTFYALYAEAMWSGVAGHVEGVYAPLDRWFEAHAYPREEGIAVYFRDVTERRQADERMRRALEEKEVLLREVHHRVKNNLQVICSMLRLQERQLSDDRLLQALRECRERVMAMAMLHDQLHRAKDFSNINLGEYIRNLAASLFCSYGVKSSDVNLRMEVEDIPVAVDTAIPCGLIVNELISNSLRHAFPDGRKGLVSVGLRAWPRRLRGDDDWRRWAGFRRMRTCGGHAVARAVAGGPPGEPDWRGCGAVESRGNAIPVCTAGSEAGIGLERKAMNKRRIMLVEDERVVAADIEECVKGLGYEVVGSAATGTEALRMAAQTVPDLILMDIKLKGVLDGIDVAGALYDQFKIPVVYLTAHADVEILERAKKTAPSGYVLKPFDDRTLRTAIEIAFDRHTRERRLIEGGNGWPPPSGASTRL